jgi:hypothetical protein
MDGQQPLHHPVVGYYCWHDTEPEMVVMEANLYQRHIPDI